MHKRFEAAVFSTAPQSADCAAEGFVDETIRVAQMSEAAGCTGILVYTDNRLVDPWLVSQLIIQNTTHLCPLVAVQPVYMHPYSVAKMVASYAHMFGRRIYLNMVAGGFKNDLVALNDTTPHDKRYDRLVEYTKIILGLCEQSRSGKAFSFAGEFYKVDALKLTPAVPEALTPGVFVSGSSEAGVAAGRAVGATIVQYPKQVTEYAAPLPKDGFNYGIRIGVVTRSAGEEAWRAARERFPEDRKGQLTHQLAMRVSDSHWHKQLSDLAASATPGSPYWMHPFENYKTFCPYLVGDYPTVAAEVGRYTDVGYNTFILDIPPSLEELRHIAEAFGRVSCASLRMTRLLQHWSCEHAQLRPESPAIVLGEQALSYAALETWSNQLAHALRAWGCTRGDRVVLFVPKSFEIYAGILAALKADCCYVPIDTSSPAERAARMVAQCEPRVALAVPSAAALVADVMAALAENARPVIGWMQSHSAVVAARSEDASRAALASLPAHAPATANTPTDLAYILFTSGSTGMPKGVMITHDNVRTYNEWAVEYFGIGPEDRLSGHSPLHFDLSMFDLFGSLFAGAALYPVLPEMNLLPNKTVEFIRTSQLTQWFSVPSAMTYLAKFDAFRDGDFPALRRVLWCGEVLPTPTLIHWMRKLPHCRFTNLYGPTEATIASSYHAVEQTPASDTAAIPIGLPCGGEELLVLDEQLRPLPPGESGDLYIAGVGLGPGYWRDAEKTAAAFKTRALSDGGTQRIYRTGDLAKIGDDGLVYFLGRADTQIKSRGYRIELGEIEAALNTLEGVGECAVVAIQAGGFEGATICCAYAPSNGVELPPGTLRKELSRKVPSYMLPAKWLALPRLPKNGSGKIDRKALTDDFARQGGK